MVGAPEAVLIVLVAIVVLGPPVLSLIAMRRDGRRWARIRIGAYGTTAALFTVHGLTIFARGNRIGGFIAGMIAWAAAKGAYGAWLAWRAGDYRPTYLRERTVSASST